MCRILIADWKALVAFTAIAVTLLLRFPPPFSVVLASVGAALFVFVIHLVLGRSRELLLWLGIGGFLIPGLLFVETRVEVAAFCSVFLVILSGLHCLTHAVRGPRWRKT